MEILEIGRKYYPKIEIRETTLSGGKNTHNRIFTNWPKNKGSYAINGFEKHLISIKLDIICRKLRNIGIIVQQSHTTNSCYFLYKEKNYRISDHDRKYTDIYHYKYLINHKTDELYLINMILSHK